MKIEQIYTGCLAQGAYYIESDGEVAIIDPLREVDAYILKAENNNAKIKYIFETHFHADFVSGHLTLSQKTGAEIIYGPTAQPAFEATIAKDGQIFKLGKISIKVLHTPGHTMESATFLLIDESGKEHAIFTGDTLFLGDVGRPDLAQKVANMTQEDLASLLYHSLRTQIMPLADDVIVYPGHGAGSACGKNMMTQTVDTLGHQKKINYALRVDMTEAEFVKEVTDGLMPPPAYFPMNVQMNKQGYKSIDQVVESGMHAFDPKSFELTANQSEALILDVRTTEEFKAGHIPKSIFIGLDGSFAPWVGELVKDVNQPLLLVADEKRLKEALIRLSRIGFDHVLGYLKGGIQVWEESGKEVDRVSSIDAITLTEMENPVIIDVRREKEFLSAHVEGAVNIPLSRLNDHLTEFDKDEFIYIHCASGYRSVIAESILKSRGYHNIADVNGGYKAIVETHIPVTDYVCPTQM